MGVYGSHSNGRRILMTSVLPYKCKGGRLVRLGAFTVGQKAKHHGEGPFEIIGLNPAGKLGVVACLLRSHKRFTTQVAGVTITYGDTIVTRVA